MTSEELVKERGATHGDWVSQAKLAQSLKNEIYLCKGTAGLKPSQREAIEMICVKISRIITGDSDHADHWSDIEGYARLGRQGHE